jgi:hypothetical protein
MIRTTTWAAVVLLTIGAEVHAAVAEIDELVIRTGVMANVGGEFRNVYTTATKDQALAKLKRFRESTTPVTVREFLECKLRRVEIISFLGDGDEACALVGELMRSIILQPGSRGLPSLDLRWDEANIIKVRAYLIYENNRVGIFESNGFHLLAQDGEGTFWWYRWDDFPRKVAEGTVGPDNGSQPVHSGTNRTSPAVGPPRR